MRKLFVRSVIAMVLFVCASRAEAIGWDSNDFLIGVGPSFITKIGVFDHDLTFKGFLDSNFAGVQGLDFDHAGRLVAVGAPEVRVYDSSGARVGGFVRSDGALGNSGDIKVTLNGSYVVGAGQTLAGARRFGPDGTLLQQYGNGEFRAVAVVPGNRIWASGIGVGMINVFDLSTGAQTGTLPLAGFTSVFSINYSDKSDSVLVVAGGSVHELDLQGNELRVFTPPQQGTLTLSATRGPNDDLFATTGSGLSGERVLHWNAVGDYLGSIQMPADFGVNGIVWAGNAPEPHGLVLAFVGFLMSHQRFTRRRM